jgi:hypothetical protein
MSLRFAADIMEETLQNIRDEQGQQWPLSLSTEQVDDIWACDWEDRICPACGRDLDHHNNNMMTRCANATL